MCVIFEYVTILLEIELVKDNSQGNIFFLLFGANRVDLANIFHFGSFGIRMVNGFRQVAIHFKNNGMCVIRRLSACEFP